MNIRGKRGSIVVETAIFLPVFIIAILTIAHLIRVIQVQETMMDTMTMQGRKLIAEEYVGSKSEQRKGQGAVVLEKVIDSKLRKGGMFLWESKSRMEKELGSWISQTALSEFRLDGEAEGLDTLCFLTMNCKVNLPTANLFHQNIRLQERVVCRGFVGKTTGGGVPFPFERMEREERNRPVYVFPRAGERYHDASCRVLHTIPKRALLNGRMKKDRDSCKLCHSGTLSVGTPVAYFESKDGAFHKTDCKALERYVICIELEKAREDGYTPCLICGGE